MAWYGTFKGRVGYAVPQYIPPVVNNPPGRKDLAIAAAVVASWTDAPFLRQKTSLLVQGASGGGGGALTLAGASFNGTQGQALTYAVPGASGGTAPYWYEVLSGSVNPFGSGSPGTLGVPAVALNFGGTFEGIALPNAETDSSIVVQVTDSVGATAQATFSLTTASASYAFNISGSNLFGYSVVDSQQPGSPRYVVYHNQQGNSGYLSAFTKGFSERSFETYAPYAYSATVINCYPFVNRGWYPAVGYKTSGSGPLQSSGLQISATQIAMMRINTDMPIDRGSVEAWSACDLYVGPTATPVDNTRSSATLNVFILPNWVDTSLNWSSMITANGSATAPTYTNYIELDGRMWFYQLQNNGFTVAPPSGQYNYIALFPAAVNDCKQGGLKYLYVNFAKMMQDLAALNAAGKLNYWDGSTNHTGATLNFSSSSYIYNLGVGWEINGGGSTPAYYLKDFQTSITATGYTAEAPISVPKPLEMSTLISRHCPVSGSSDLNGNPLSYVTSGNYNQWFKGAQPTVGAPVTLQFDLTGTPSAQLAKLKFVIWANLTSQFYGGVFGAAGAYTIQGSANGSTGWTTLFTETGNVVAWQSKYVANPSLFPYVKIVVTAPAAGASTTYLEMKVDIYAVTTQTNANTHGHTLFGDSHTKKYMNPYFFTEENGAAEYAGNILSHYHGTVSPMIGCGNSGWSLSIGTGTSGNNDFISWFNGTNGTWIDDTDSMFIHFFLGTNDATIAGVTSTQFKTDLTWCVNHCLSLGKIAVLWPVIYSADDSGTTSSTWSAYVRQVYATFSSNPNVLMGAPIDTIFAPIADICWNLSVDPVHMIALGQAIYRSVITDYIGRVIELGMPASAWVMDFSNGASGVGVGGH